MYPMGTRQLQLFSTAELAVMRDRTASRNYSPGCDEFRREHLRHRAWGLKRRHAERLHRRRDSAERTPSGDGGHSERQAPRSVPSVVVHKDGARVLPGDASSRTGDVVPQRANCAPEPCRTRPAGADGSSGAGGPAPLVAEDAPHAPTDLADPADDDRRSRRSTRTIRSFGAELRTGCRKLRFDSCDI